MLLTIKNNGDACLAYSSGEYGYGLRFAVCDALLATDLTWDKIESGVFSPFFPALDLRLSSKDYSILKEYLSKGASSFILNYSTIKGRYGLGVNERTFFDYTDYQLRSFFDVFAAVLHFLALNNYRICFCAHCGRIFVVKNENGRRNVTYCDRFSTYPGYTNYRCGAAVTAIMGTLKHRYKSIECALYARSSCGKDYQDYMIQRAPIMATAKKQASIKNLAALETFLYVDCAEKYGVQKKTGRKRGFNK